METDVPFRHGNPNPGLALRRTKAWSEEGVLGLETGPRVVFASSRKDFLFLVTEPRVQQVVFVRSRTGHGCALRCQDRAPPGSRPVRPQASARRAPSPAGALCRAV